MNVRLVLGAAVLALSVLPARSRGEGLPAHLTATFEHADPNAAYVGRLAGVVDLELTPGQGGSGLVVVRLDPSDGSCFATMSWALASATDGRATRVVEVCLTGATAAGTELDAFFGGQSGSADPSLEIALVPGSTQGHLTNPTPVTSRAFVRGCTGAPYRRYGELVFAAGALDFVPFVDQEGYPQLELMPASADVTGVDPGIWADVLTSCRGNDRSLPQTPTAGTTSDLAATSVFPPPPPGPHEDIRLLGQAVTDLVTGGMLSASQARPLTRSLDKAAAKLREGRATKAIKKMGSFVRRTQQLVARGLLSQNAAQPLIYQGGAVQSSITVLAFSGPVRMLHSSCPTPAPCDPTVFYVRVPGGGIVPVPDGTPERPFASIADALQRAEDDGLCGVEVQVANGRYDDDLVITRPTAIVGASQVGVQLPITVLNTGAHRLEITRVTFDGSSIVGAVVVDNACAATILTDVRIQDAQRFGVRQQGGTLEAEDLTIVRTQSTGGDPAYGTAIHLSGGVKATLITITLLGNEGGGLAAIGSATDVSLNDAFIQETGVNPFFRDAIVAGDAVAGLAAVEVHDGAVLEVEASFVFGSEYIGLLVDNGAQATFAHGSVDFTQSVDADGRSVGGFNVLASRGAALQLTNFNSRRADSVGLGILNAGVDYSVGEVSRCTCGAYVNSEGFDLARVQDDVDYVDNDQALCADSLPVPHNLASI